MNEPPQQTLMDLLVPILTDVTALDPSSRTSDEATTELEKILEHKYPYDGERVQAIGKEIERGVAEGWLCNRGDENARFSRLAKPSDDTAGLSIDVVSMTGEALEHTHPNGEVTIGFATGGDDTTFEGRPPGWIFCRAGSRHVPTVRGGRMNLIYFLPGGAVEWHPPPS